MKTLWPTYRIVLFSLVLGIVASPIVLPMVASWGGNAAAQSLPFTPTPEPVSTTAAPTNTLVPTATRSASPTATHNPDDPILGSPTIQTPIYQATDIGGSATATSSTGDSSTTATPTPTPRPGTIPDRCEPNESLVQPCALPTEIENADLNFVDDSIDVFSLILKGGRTYTIRAESSDGIDPAIIVYRAGDTQTVIAQNDDLAPGSSAAQVQIATEADSWYLVVIENKAPGDMRGRTYRVTARSSTAVTPTVNPVATSQAGAVPVQAAGGDLYENNYSPETAGTLAWGVPYDLSLICPVPGQCPGGDHDFFWMPVKSGVPIVAVTYDLGPGADPAMTIYRPEAGFTDPSTGLVGWRAWAGNDDVVPGFTLRSQTFVTPDWSGYALMVIASSERTDPPPLPPAVGAPGRYRLMVGPPGLAAVKKVIESQTDIPIAPTTVAPTLPPTSQPVDAPLAPTPAGDTREVIKEESATGMAVVVKRTVLYAAAPPSDNDALATYPEAAQVRLLGQTYAGWVKVQPLDSVTPGWMFGPNLRPLQVIEGTASPTRESAGGGPGGSPGATPVVPGPTSVAGPAGDVGGTSVLDLSILDPLTVPTSVGGQPVARTVRVTLCAAAARPGETTCASPIRNMRVDLVLAATQTTLVQNTTDRDGTVTLSASVPDGTMLLVRVSALGVQSELRNQTATLIIRVVGGE